MELVELTIGTDEARVVSLWVRETPEDEPTLVGVGLQVRVED